MFPDRMEELSGVILEYCKRINLNELPPATEAGLNSLQLAQRIAIPFENLDVRLNREIRLDHESITRKLVMGSRGGYCFEQNLLLSHALEAMGVASRPALARVWLGATYTPPLTHLVLLAQIGKARWLMDAGFGGGYCPPLPLTDGSEALAPDGSTYGLTTDAELGWILHRCADGSTMRQFSFTENQVFFSDILLANHWTSTHPASLFKKTIVVNRITKDGRLSLVDAVLTRTGGRHETVIITSSDQMASIVREEFGLALSTSEIGDLAAQINLIA
jgi:N-hydroxyarylamine O-acetyltransferase